jgi:repressor LexA
MTIGDRVRLKRIEKGLTQTELAEKLGYKSKSSVAHIEKGRDIPRSLVVTLSEILDTTPAYIMGWTDEKSNVASVLPPKLYRVPLYESVSAGFGAYADSQIREYYEVYVESPCVAKNTIAIRVKGDSMYPKIEDGDTILVQRDADVKSGDIGVALIDDDAFVKKVEYDPKALRLISINPEYPPKVFQGKEADRVRIVGRVYRIIKEC